MHGCGSNRRRSEVELILNLCHAFDVRVVSIHGDGRVTVEGGVVVRWDAQTSDLVAVQDQDQAQVVYIA